MADRDIVFKVSKSTIRTGGTIGTTTAIAIAIAKEEKRFRTSPQFRRNELFQYFPFLVVIVTYPKIHQYMYIAQKVYFTSLGELFLVPRIFRLQFRRSNRLFLEVYRNKLRDNRIYSQFLYYSPH